MRNAEAVAALTQAIARGGAHSPFLRELMRRRPEIVAALAEGLDTALALARAAAADDPVARSLRRERQGVALALGLADLAGLAPFETVTRTLSDFADRALDRAIAAAVAERVPGAPPVGFAALALGKHGSGELNYSSDIDPILIFDPATLPRRAGEEPVAAATRIARRAAELLQARDADGHVFRVDLRLRPSPEATPPALPVAAAIAYYESSALPWERAAFIRARAAAGDVALGRAFLDAVRPFVWRRSLDYGAVGEIRGMSARIRGHHAQGQALGPGYDLKRGRGGIREVEFFAQIHQLIHGGREPALRAPATLDALAALAAAGRIDRGDAAALADAYRLLRTIEHRLQMVDDRQTHGLPRDPAALDGVARLHGLADGAALVALLAPHVDAVGRIYDGLAPARAGDTLPRDPALLEERLGQAGFADPAAARMRIEHLRGGARPAVRGQAARDALEALLPGLVAAFGRGAGPGHALNRFDDLVARLPTAMNLFNLLAARPTLAALLGEILALAPALADELGRRPALLDGLIDASAFDPPGPVAAIAAGLAAGEAGEDYQALLDRVRAAVGERRFALGARIVAGTADPLDVAAGHARLAEAALDVLGHAAVADFARAHGGVPGGELIVLALGRFGGEALTHASDLDLVYLFTGDHLAESDGARPLGATLYFNRLAQRVTAALSVPTAAGPLYSVDTRLRPSGGDGLLAVSVESFARYQRESAWTWEHMALCRARVVFGSAGGRAQVAAVVAGTLARPRDAAMLKADARRMRAEMARHKPARSLLDVKLGRGGLVDLEFTVHLLQLIHNRAMSPRLDVAVAALVGAGLLPPDLAAAHALLTRMLVTLRLVAPDLAEPPAAVRALLARACRRADWPALVAASDAARQSVAEAWAAISEE